MIETLNLLFRSCGNGGYEVQLKGYSSHQKVSGNFVPPYTSKQLNAIYKKLNSLECSDAYLREVGQRLFYALCDMEADEVPHQLSSKHPVYTVLSEVIRRTINRRGTVALTLSFDRGCDELVRYPWELLHNGDHFLLASGVFTLTRALLQPEMSASCELPVHLPIRILYIGSSPEDCVPLETERSFQALERGLERLIENRQVQLDRLEPPTFDQLVRYLNSYGGVNKFNDNEITVPCYVVHFDGHGAHGRLCPNDECERLNEPNARKCTHCGESLTHVKTQTYLCFCNDDGSSHLVETQSLRNLFFSGDVRLAVFSACETAMVTVEYTRHHQHKVAVDATLATALVTAQVPAVVAMPFSLQDDLSPTFMYHFYEALADGRTLEEALSRARQALLPRQHKSWFIPVLYRHVVEGQEMPVPLLVSRDVPEEHDHPLAHLGVPATYIGRTRELQDLELLLTASARGEQVADAKAHLKLRPGTHHIALTGPVGIGKSALACEAIRRSQHIFPGGIIGISLQGGKAFADALTEILQSLHLVLKTSVAADVNYRKHYILRTLRSLADRELPCLLLLDGFEEVKDHAELETWLHFLCSLPTEMVVMVTSRFNPETMMVVGSPPCRWYEYHVGKMEDADLLDLFAELASSSGLDQRIHLDDSQQQAILREICTLLDGYPLGAELIFGTTRSIGGKVYTPEAATRSLEEVCDELRETPLAGILAVLDVAYHRLSPLARLLLAYLASFQLPFSREQIVLLVAPETTHAAQEAIRLVRKKGATFEQGEMSDEEILPAELAVQWPTARDELVQASFMQFDGRMYTIHPQVRYFALSHLPLEERRRIHRVVAHYYATLPQPTAEEWVAAVEHLEHAGETQDLQASVRVAVQASWALYGRGHTQALLRMLRRVGVHAVHLGDKTGEGQIQCCLGAILRQLGHYTEAEACLRSSLEFHKNLQEHGMAAWALYELAMLLREEGNFQQANDCALEALTLFHEGGDVGGEAWVHMVLGEVYRGYGAYIEALGHFERALSSFHNLSNREGYASVLRDQGTVYEALGKYSKALTDYNEALKIFSELGLSTGRAWVLVDKGVVCTDQRKLDEAEKLCGEALTLFREQGIRRGEAWTLRALGDTMRERKNVEKARTYYEEAETIFTALGDRVDQARVLSALAAVSFDENEFLAAQEQYEQAHAIAREQGAKQIEGRALRGMGDVARVMRRFADAERYYHEAITIALAIETPAEQCAVLRRQGRLYEEMEKHKDVLACWVHALALDLRLGHPARADLQERVTRLVKEQHLEEEFNAFCKQYGL